MGKKKDPDALGSVKGEEGDFDNLKASMAKENFDLSKGELEALNKTMNDRSD